MNRRRSARDRDHSSPWPHLSTHEYHATSRPQASCSLLSVVRMICRGYGGPLSKSPSPDTTWVEIGDAPGLGVTLDEAKVAEFAVKP